MKLTLRQPVRVATCKKVAPAVRGVIGVTPPKAFYYVGPAPQIMNGAQLIYRVITDIKMKIALQLHNIVDKHCHCIVAAPFVCTSKIKRYEKEIHFRRLYLFALEIQ